MPAVWPEFAALESCRFVSGILYMEVVEYVIESLP